MCSTRTTSLSASSKQVGLTWPSDVQICSSTLDLGANVKITIFGYFHHFFDGK
jgi:hypothetical protein